MDGYQTIRVYAFLIQGKKLPEVQAKWIFLDPINLEKRMDSATQLTAPDPAA